LSIAAAATRRIETMPDAPKQVLQPVTPEVIAEVCALVATADQAALATLEPESGWPLASRAGLALLDDGTPLIIASALTPHFSALVADPRCSLLVGEAGKGEPLARPRVTLVCRAQMLDPASAEASAARACYVARHPKAAVYVDLPDFRFFRLSIQRARFNGGFGRAYEIEGALLAAGPVWSGQGQV
jgi:putative heme iron utilization protein